jgi:hypothetical protein
MAKVYERKAAGAIGWIGKPFDLEHLVATEKVLFIRGN